MWLQSGRTDTVARRMYDEAMDALVRNIIQTSAGGLTYASDMKYERLEHKMDHLACFSGKTNRIQISSELSSQHLYLLHSSRWIICIGSGYSTRSEL